MMPWAHKLRRPPSPLSSLSSPTSQSNDAKVVRWLDPITGVDTDVDESNHGINGGDDVESGGSPEQGDEENQQQMVVTSRKSEPKLDRSWAKSKFPSFSFSCKCFFPSWTLYFFFCKLVPISW